MFYDETVVLTMHSIVERLRKIGLYGAKTNTLNVDTPSLLNLFACAAP